MRLRLISVLVVLVIGIFFIINTVLVVDAGHVAVIFNTVNGNLSTRYPGTADSRRPKSTARTSGKGCP